jgi:hypothetical protein
MRSILALGIAAAIAVGAAAVADGATPAKTYLTVSARGYFYYGLDYGKDPDGVFNDAYVKTVSWSMRAIAIYDRGRFSVPARSMIVSGGVNLLDRRTQWKTRTSRAPVDCPAKLGRTTSPAPDYRIWSTTTGGARFSAGSVSLASGSVKVDPGPAIVWNIGCDATETLEHHGLQGGPWFTVSAPGKSSFTGTKVFGVGCKDSYQHAFKPPGTPNGHAFQGVVQLSVMFIPFSESNLAATKQRLRDRVGEKISPLAPSSSENCP